MNKLAKVVDKYPFKQILYLNWFEAAIAHLLLFKYYVEKYSQNVYFLISEQGIFLKASTKDYLQKAEEQINRFFTARIDELEISGSVEFYDNIIEDIKEQTEKLKDARDCPYINLVYSQKLRNSCVAMRKLGYVKPYENWECHERERKGFCFLIVRPEHRWKQIASNVYSLARKRQSSYSKSSTDHIWPVAICYQKFIWFYLKQSFKDFKKSLEIKDNKADKCLTIVIKKEIPELADLQKEIDSLMFFYKPTIPRLHDEDNKRLVLSPLEVQKITELIYHEFGLTSCAKQLRKKMTGYLVITSSQFRDSDEQIGSQKEGFSMWDKQQINCIQHAEIKTVAKLGRRHNIVIFDKSNYVQLRIDKPLKDNYERILKVRLPCLPRYYHWHQNQNSYFLLRPYLTTRFLQAFENVRLFDQMRFLYSIISIVDELHQRGILIGTALTEACFIDEKRVIVEPQQTSSKEEDIHRLKKLVESCIKLIRQNEQRHEVEEMLRESKEDPFGLLEYLEDYIDENS